MHYKIEKIGAFFTDEGIKNLEQDFNKYAEQGFKFHSVIEVETPSGCMGNGKPLITYLAVYEKIDFLFEQNNVEEKLIDSTKVEVQDNIMEFHEADNKKDKNNYLYNNYYGR